MVRQSCIAMLISIGALAAGCGSSGESNDAVRAPVESTTDAPTTPGVAPTTGAPQSGGIAGAVEAAVEGIDDASTATCDINRQTLEIAAQAYQALNGTLPTSQDDLVVAALIIEPAPGFEITPDGLVQAIAGGPCVSP